MTTLPDLALLGSPLLGPAAWEPVAASLQSSGRAVVLAPAVGGACRTPADVLASLRDALPTDRDLVLVPHSGAGWYVPALCDSHQVVGAVFVDAVLPPPAGEVGVAPPSLLDVVGPRVQPDDLLPPWTRWWDEAVVATLFGDDAVRRRVEEEQPRVPLAYLRSRVQVTAGWDEDLPAAYLAFGETYAEERGDAEARGWPVLTLAGARHLHMTVDPPGVAATLLELADRLSRPPRGRGRSGSR